MSKTSLLLSNEQNKVQFKLRRFWKVVDAYSFDFNDDDELIAASAIMIAVVHFKGMFSNRDAALGLFIAYIVVVGIVLILMELLTWRSRLIFLCFVLATEINDSLQNGSRTDDELRAKWRWSELVLTAWEQHNPLSSIIRWVCFQNNGDLGFQEKMKFPDKIRLHFIIYSVPHQYRTNDDLTYFSRTSCCCWSCWPSSWSPSACRPQSAFWSVSSPRARHPFLQSLSQQPPAQSAFSMVHLLSFSIHFTFHF